MLTMPKETGITDAHVALWGFMQGATMATMSPLSVRVHLAKLCEAHQLFVAQLLVELATKNGVMADDIMAAFDRAFDAAGCTS